MINEQERVILLGDGVELNREQVLDDYRLGWISRQVSLIGRREVLGGKAKFGIFGDGKEVPQLALARAFRPGDFRSGYYRDQTLMFATGMSRPREYFAQLFAHPDMDAEPATGGRSMNAHFATRFLHDDGTWRQLVQHPNSSADLSPTGSQMPRMVGLTYASVLYRGLPELAHLAHMSDNGNEVVWGTIGDASCAEGLFWEAVNAIGVLGGPMVLSLWDDGYGISVPGQYQVTRDLSQLLKGFQRPHDGGRGYDLYAVRAWEYPALVAAYHHAARTARRQHVPAIVHVTEVTQPQGHSTSGSHERYKSKERLAFEAELDCLRQMRLWLLEDGIATADELDAIEAHAYDYVEAEREAAWQAYLAPLQAEAGRLAVLLDGLAAEAPQQRARITAVKTRLAAQETPLRRDMGRALREALVATRNVPGPARQALVSWQARFKRENARRYGSHLYCETGASPLKVPEVKPEYLPDAPEVFGFNVINAAFDHLLGRDGRVVAFGEDVGFLGDVNQGFKGLQQKYGPLRVSDTGIREATIIGQAIGLAQRGFRPIAEIQYLDYVLYALQILSDDLATLHWRTVGGQKAPVIVRTRGHRLEGTWHSGSPMAGILHLLRGLHVLVPRDFTRAAGFYNTLLEGDDPALVVEVLNGYRVRERMPANIGQLTVPLGVPEILRPGRDVTVVTYGACCRIVLEAAAALAEVGVEVEVVDVQSLLPFDRPGMIGESLKKTGRILFVDEDVPGGTTAYMLQEVLEKQQGYFWLDALPRTLPATQHRPPYGSDGDYFSKPNVEDVFEAVYDLMHEADPAEFPAYDL